MVSCAVASLKNISREKFLITEFIVFVSLNLEDEYIKNNCAVVFFGHVGCFCTFSFLLNKFMCNLGILRSN